MVIDAELFGAAKNYPNAGMPERPGVVGVVGEADGGTLFLDEVGELAHALQAHLLRVLDSGEYHRLGESRVRQVDIRLIAATNRPAQELKHDFAARMLLRVNVPGLQERRDDIPLLAQHLMCARARQERKCEPFVATRPNGTSYVRMKLPFLKALLSHEYTSHIRELERLLLMSATTSRGDSLQLTKEVEAELGRSDRLGTLQIEDNESPGESGPVSAHEVPPPSSSIRPGELSAEQIQAALDRNNGVLDSTYRELGLRNRFVLHRLIRKHGLVVARRPRTRLAGD